MSVNKVDSEAQGGALEVSVFNPEHQQHSFSVAINTTSLERVVLLYRLAGEKSWKYAKTEDENEKDLKDKILTIVRPIFQIHKKKVEFIFPHRSIQFNEKNLHPQTRQIFRNPFIKYNQ